MPVKFHAPGQPLSAKQQAALYYARKKTRDLRIKSDVPRAPGSLKLTQNFGVSVSVTLTTA